MAKDTKEKAKKIAKKAADVATDNWKPIAVGVGVLILGIAAVKAFNFIKNGGNDPNSGGGNVGNHNNPSNVPQGASITVSQAESKAAQILGAIDSIGKLSNSEYAIVKDALQGMNPYDFAMISNAFGMPRRNPVTGEESFWPLGEKLNLLQWLQIELKPDQRIDLRKVMPGVI